MTSRNISIESTVKDFARAKDDRAAYFAITTNYYGDMRYKIIHEKRMNLLQKTKLNGHSYVFELHISNQY